ncbi:hypothetical protein [Amycolatopsis pittospori]|uniref:hypothetical protein n=1 Tax=Amycolatopsis pittospori TaxID=2749434 RepID=UPI0015F071FF|nr:hypothetical protein [Amycolatopsis pittospori]
MSDPQRPSGDDDKTVEQPAVSADEAAKTEKPAETTAETPAAAPAGPPRSSTAPPPTGPSPAAAVPPAAVQPPRKGGFRRFAAARATQLVAVGVLGFVLGGGIIGTAVGLASRDGGRHGDRPGFSREYRGPDGHGPHRDFRDGPGERGPRNGGN